MIFDTHMHCDFSTDSSMSLEEAIAAAEKENIGMIVTEHWDYDYPTNPTEFIFDLSMFNKFWIARPFEILVPSGISYTFNQ